MVKLLNKTLLQDKCIKKENLILSKILCSIDEVLISTQLNEDVIGLFEKFSPVSSSAINEELIVSFRKFARVLFDGKQYYESLLLYRFIIAKSILEPVDYFYIGKCCYFISQPEIAFFFFEMYEKLGNNKLYLYIDLANFFNLETSNYNKAIFYYKKYLEYDSSKAIIYTTLAALYKKIGNKEEYINSLLLALKLTPHDSGIIRELAFAYEGIFDNKNAKLYYELLLQNNPTNNDYFNYGCLLITCGDLLKGHEYFIKRPNKFLKEIPPEKQWFKGCDISGKNILVTYEQGFGDTFMYCRLLPLLKKITSQVIFYAQDELVDLLKNSPKISDGIEILSNKYPISNITYDINIPLFDLMYILKISRNELPVLSNYINVRQDLAEDFRKKYIKTSNKLKIGIAYHGDINANYYGRDLEESDFYYLVENFDADFYSLQFGEKTHNSRIISLGQDFKDFSDSAAAIENMDIIITTDNVILNLAGAIGVETLGLFNQVANFRWHNLNGENVEYYNNVHSFQCKKNNIWSDVFIDILKYLQNKPH